MHANPDIQNIHDMLAEEESRFLEIAFALRKLHEDKPQAFAEVTEAPPLSRRRGYYFVEIARAFENKPQLHEQVRRVGWTKAAVLAKCADDPDIVDLLALAEKVTVFQLQAYLKQGAEGLEGGVLVFGLEAKAYAGVVEVLKSYGAIESSLGLKGKESALLAALALNA